MSEVITQKEHCKEAQTRCLCTHTYKHPHTCTHVSREERRDLTENAYQKARERDITDLKGRGEKKKKKKAEYNG